MERIVSETPGEGYREDTTIWPVLEELQRCLCATLDEHGVMPGKCLCGIVPGAEVSWDFPDGIAWVRLIAVAPVAGLDRSSCGVPLEAEIEVGVLNCAPTPTARGVLPDEAALRESARLQMAAMDAMRRAITCCYEGDHLSLGIYTPLGPQGGLVGGSWTATYGAY